MAESSKDKDLFKFVPYSAEKAEFTASSGYSYWGSVFHNFTRKKVTMVMAAIFVILFVSSMIIPLVGKYQVGSLVPDSDMAFQAPSAEHWFGTDNLGRDYWCQVWYASRISICLSLLVAVGELVIGVIFGLIWGYVQKLDGFFTAIYNIVNNIPEIIYLTLVSLLVGQGFWIMAASLIAFGWLTMARNVRNMVLMYRNREFNLASRCLGTPVRRILSRNILPQLVSVIILRLALSIPGTIGMESTLSFLGLGMDVNTPSLGILLRNARVYFLEYPYLLIFPAIIVSLITVTFYLVGNAFSDASDPKNHV